MTQNEKIKNLYNNINYILEGIHCGWLDIPNPQIIEICTIIKYLSQHSYDELFDWKKERKVQIKIK